MSHPYLRIAQGDASLHQSSTARVAKTVGDELFILFHMKVLLHFVPMTLEPIVIVGEHEWFPQDRCAFVENVPYARHHGD